MTSSPSSLASLASRCSAEPAAEAVVRRWPARCGVSGDWPDWVSAEIRSAWRGVGVQRPWRHQILAAEAARAGRDVVLATGTASGKSLGFLLPVLAATVGSAAEAPIVVREPVGDPRPWAAGLRGDRPHTALYLAPTKALAHDQLRVARSLAVPRWPVGALDGDSEPAERDWARDHGRYLLSNPDMLHYSLLPQHTRWASFLAALRYVVVDEAHRYRGVFGAQVACVLRRLRRLAAHYGTDPVFLVASATTANAGEAAAALIGASEAALTVVDQDDSARGAREVVIRPPSARAEEDTAALLADLVQQGRQTIAFTPSRRSAELVALAARARLRDAAGGAARSSAPSPRIEAYRAGYLAEDRRRLERALQDGSVAGVAATNALELGVDISGLDAVVISGFPGTRAAFWQQAGRAARRGGDATIVLVARRSPLDAYLFDHPDTLLAAPVEATVLYPENPYVLGAQLAAAAQELPATSADTRYFGLTVPRMLKQLEREGVLRRRPNGWYWTRSERAVDLIDLRAAGGSSVEIVEAETGRVLGYVDPAAADATVHPGAVYLHQGDTYLCEDLDHEAGEAIVRPATPPYYTQPRSRSAVRVLTEDRSRLLGDGRVAFGSVEVTSQVVGYLRRDAVTGTVWDESPLDLPERTLRTKACWWTLDPARVEASLTAAQLTGGLHGLEHAAVNLLPVYAPCDRWDVGSVPVVGHPDTADLTVFAYDNQAGGAGFAERGYQVVEAWLAATLERLTLCPCETGCPACVVSATCSSQAVLDKQSAVVLLRHLVGTPRPG